jgi:5-methylcytosine-specific restriction enzyme subunit McrC
MLAYAVRFEVDEIILFYPNTLKQDQEKNTQMIIKDALANGKEITIRAFQLPIINRTIFEEEYNPRLKLSELLSEVRFELINKLSDILK